ncbi:MAG: glutathione S-transferase [Betaproteobacteria bacterium]
MITLCGFAVSGYYNKLKLILLEKDIPFREKLVYPWERDSFQRSSPIGKIPFVETEYGALSESQVILDYLEERYPERPMYPSDRFARAKCRELIQHLELNAEWVSRRLYKEAFFGGSVSDEDKREARERLPKGLAAVAQLSHFSPYIFGSSLSAADCAAYMHFLSIRITTQNIYGENILDRFFPALAAYIQLMESRPHLKKVLAERETALAAFRELDVSYDG